MLKTLNSKELLSRTQNLVAEERRVTLALVEHLEEIQARRLHNELGFSSLWEFCTQYLGLSEGAAQRRISAMRLARDVPEAKLMEISPQALPTERERVVSASQDREIRLVISPELYEKLQRIKGLLAHSKPNASYAELLEYLVEETLPRLEKKRGVSSDPKTQVTIAAAAGVAEGLGHAVQASSLSPEIAEKARVLPKGKRVYLPAALKRAVYARSGGRCEYTADGKRCSSRYMLEIDHRVPLSGGGGHEFSQLRSLCRQHNLQQFDVWSQSTAERRRTGRANPTCQRSFD
jgi:5-methylcytosine-specific restriction endonuclease McrA